MKSKLMNSVVGFGVVLALPLLSHGAPEGKDSKNVTVITAQSSADGGSTITTEKVKECLGSLPSIEGLEAEIHSEVKFLRDINGKTGDNRQVKVHTARLEVNYMLHQQDLIIVTTKSVQGQQPAFREVERELKQTREFSSNPANGDIFAGKSNSIQYYFSTPEAAAKDAKERARIWLASQVNVLCRK